ncbi:MAG: hypothetical protein ACI9IL_001158 [Rickettsiales bacterium]|jgi:hypothetical protein
MTLHLDILAKSGVATGGNNNKIQQNNTATTKSTLWKWLVGYTYTFPLFGLFKNIDH